MSNEIEYETVYIMRADLTDDMTKKANDKIGEMVQRYGGRLEPLKDMGKKQLAYPIAKMSRGHYFQLNYFGSGKTTEELERHLKMSEDIIRFLTVKAVHYAPYQDGVHGGFHKGHDRGHDNKGHDSHHSNHSNRGHQSHQAHQSQQGHREEAGQ